jgi:ribonuclease P protein component
MRPRKCRGIRHEAPLSAVQTGPQAPPWLPFAHGDSWWPQGSGPPPRPRPQEALGLNSPSETPKSRGLSLDRLKKRADFLRAARTTRRVVTSLTLETCLTPDDEQTHAHIRVGFTASRKVGNAVARNRAKRRLRAAAAAILPLHGREGHDYVLVARTATLTRVFADLLGDLETALKAAHSKGEQR